MTWQPPPGLTVETIHPRGDGAVEVALATLAPGAVVPWDAHAFTERLRVLSGGVCVTVEREHGERVSTDLMTAGRKQIEIAPSVRHEVVNWNRREPATVLVVMVHPTAGALANVRAALPDGETATNEEIAAFLSARGETLGEEEPF